MMFERTRLKALIDEAVSLFSKEPPLIRLSMNEVIVVGDTHGDYISTSKALETAEKENTPIIFLGDYVDRGPQQLENIIKLLEVKVSSPTSTYLIRGNHESVSMNISYGFYRVVTKELGGEWYDKFVECFKQMPLSILLNRRILLLHGGIPEHAKTIEDFEKIPKGEEDPTDPVSLQILWNDPDEFGRGFSPSPRGPGIRLFGEDVFTQFMERNGLKLLIRSHEPQPMGYRFIFGDKLLTVFSCRYYGIPPKAARLLDDKVRIFGLD